MKKMKLPLQDFLTLVGPAQILEVVDESNGQKNNEHIPPLFSDKAVKARDHEELLSRDVKHIQPTADPDHEGKYIFKIWIY